MTESEAYFALNLVPDMGAATVRAGIALFGSAAAFFEAGATRLADVSGIGPRRAERRLRRKPAGRDDDLRGKRRGKHHRRKRERHLLRHDIAP